MPVDPERLYARIRDRARSEGDLDAALSAVAAEIAPDREQLRAMWDLFGAWWLQQTYRELSARCGGVGASPALRAGAFPVEATEGSPAVVERARRGQPMMRSPSWRTRVDPLEMELPVGDTGVRKKLGDFTAQDALAVREAYIARARGMEALARRWQEIATRLGEERLLREIADELILQGCGHPQLAADLAAHVRLPAASAATDTPPFAEL